MFENYKRMFKFPFQKERNAQKDGVVVAFVNLPLEIC